AAVAHSAASTLSLHDALPIYGGPRLLVLPVAGQAPVVALERAAEVGGIVVAHAVGDLGHGQLRFDEHLRRDFHAPLQHVLVDRQDRKSTRLNSSHVKTSYAVF